MHLVKLIERELSSIELPSVTRPSVGPKDPATEELVQWGITLHVYSEIAHIRTVLGGLILLADIGNTPSGSVLARHVFEWTALASYLFEKFEEFIAKSQWPEAFALLLKVDTANSWAKKHGHKYDPSSVPQDIADPIRIRHLIAAYARCEMAQYGMSQVEDSYGLLSEYSHPNAACFLPYREFDGRRAFFVAPSAQSTFGGINGFAVQWLLLASKLLILARENVVSDRLVLVLKMIVEAAKPRP